MNPLQEFLQFWAELFRPAALAMLGFRIDMREPIPKAKFRERR